MRKTTYLFTAAALITCASVAIASGLLAPASSGNTAQAEQAPASASPWGADYFPNVELITHEGETVRFFDDLIKDKVVMINFIYTSCPDSCPLETARLAEVANILGDRIGDDVFIYSITIDPDTDTPEVLAQYRKRYQARVGWTFLTGAEADITMLRKKLGLYIPEIQSDDSNNHNLSLIIGNQKTGRWMKRSPFENPYVLAKHVGSWLHNWKLPSTPDKDFANAPRLRNLSDGERLFRTRCAACHTIGGEVVGGAAIVEATLGPDLLGVTERREPAWLARWIAEPDKMLEEKDPIAMGLFLQYNQVPMPNMRLSETDVTAIVEFLASESERIAGQKSSEQARNGLTIRSPWIREAHAEATANAGYLTIVNSSAEDQVLVGLSSPAYYKVELHEMFMDQGVHHMREIPSLEIAAGGSVALEPGGMHLMLIRPHRPLTAGESVPVTLKFQSGMTWEITIPVRE